MGRGVARVGPQSPIITQYLLGRPFIPRFHAKTRRKGLCGSADSFRVCITAQGPAICGPVCRSQQHLTNVTPPFHSFNMWRLMSRGRIFLTILITASTALVITSPIGSNPTAVAVGYPVTISWENSVGCVNLTLLTTGGSVSRRDSVLLASM